MKHAVPQTEAVRTENENGKPKKRSKLLLLLVLFLLLTGIGIAAYVYLQPEEEAGPSFAKNASVGALPGRTPEEIEAMLTQRITDKTVAYTINAYPVFESGTSKGNLMLESPANNINYIEFTIRRDDTGELLYQSGLLEPNQYIDEDRLLVDLDPGTYVCTAEITLYDPETLKSKGMTQAEIHVTVKK